MDRATTMTIVNRLQERAYMRRERSDSDGRKQALYLTEPGVAALAEAKAAIAEHEAWLKGRFSAAGNRKTGGNAGANPRMSARPGRG